jgi:hypothetical protein
LNLYAYAASDPGSLVEPSGLLIEYRSLNSLGEGEAVLVSLTSNPWSFHLFDLLIGQFNWGTERGWSIYLRWGLGALLGPQPGDGTSAGGGGRRDKIWFGNTCGAKPNKLDSLAGDVRYRNPDHAKVAFRPEVAMALSSAVRKMNSQGIVPTISDLGGYRTADDQLRAQRESGTNPAAGVGRSWHQDSRAVDFRGIETPPGATIRRIMADNGFSRIRGDIPHFQDAPQALSPRPTR